MRWRLRCVARVCQCICTSFVYAGVWECVRPVVGGGAALAGGVRARACACVRAFCVSACVRVPCECARGRVSLEVSSGSVIRPSVRPPSWLVVGWLIGLGGFRSSRRANHGAAEGVGSVCAECEELCAVEHRGVRGRSFKCGVHALRACVRVCLRARARPCVRASRCARRRLLALLRGLVGSLAPCTNVGVCVFCDVLWWRSVMRPMRCDVCMQTGHGVLAHQQEHVRPGRGPPADPRPSLHHCDFVRERAELRMTARTRMEAVS